MYIGGSGVLKRMEGLEKPKTEFFLVFVGVLWFFLSKLCKENRDGITYYCEAYDGLSFFTAFT